MAAHDGSIRIDTKIDASGVNKGTKEISKSIGGIQKTLTGMLKSLAGGLVGAVTAAIVAVGLSLAALGKILFDVARDVIQDFDIMGSAVGEQIRPLSDAIETLRGAFLNLLLQAFLPMVPTLIEIVHWFTTMLQTVTQMVAAFFGFDTTVGGIMTKAAAGAKKLNKEAKGALAAFDKINVLQEKQAGPDQTTGPTASPAPISVPDDLLERIQRLKDRLAELFGTFLENGKKAWENFINFLSRSWKLFTFLWDAFWKSPIGELLKKIAQSVVETWRKMFGNVMQTLQNIWDGIVKAAAGIIEFLVGVFRGDWELAWQGLKDIVAGVFEIIAAIVAGAVKGWLLAFEGMLNVLGILIAPIVAAIGRMWDALVDHVKAIWNNIITLVTGAKDKLISVWKDLANWFKTNVFAPIANGFGSMLTDIRLGFQSAFDGIKTFIKGTINNIIDFINRMIEGVILGINTVIGAANAVSELVGAPEIASVSAPKIPRLATGAVVPAHANMLAMIGEGSKSEIVSPVDLMRQTFEESLAKALANQTIVVKFEGTMGQLVRQLQPHIEKEKVRIGGSLLSSGATK